MPAKSQAQQRFMGMVHAAQKGDLSNASPEVKKAADSMSDKSAEEFASTSHKGLPKRVHKENTLGQIIGQYNSHGSKLRDSASMREMAEDLMELAEFAEQAIMSEADDWYDGHTIKRNMKELKNYVNEFNKIASEYDVTRQRATALYDDIGRVLERYFEIHEDDTQDFDFQYDTDGDGENDLVAGNAPKDPVDPAHLSQMAHEGEHDNDDIDETGEKFKHLTHQLAGKGAHDPKALAAWIGRKKLGQSAFQKKAAAGKHEISGDAGETPNPSGSISNEPPVPSSDDMERAKNKDLIERLLRLARHKLTGEQLARFDVLPEETKIKAAWRMVR